MDFSPSKIKLIIGLGNPDKQYENTYHNVGHLFVDKLTTDDKRLTTKSDVYMNESGKFVAKAAKKTSAKPEEILIAHDDSDLEIGKYKIDFGRGAAGHHGIESIQQHLKTNDFWRVRIGIRPANEEVRQKAEEFVLKKISAANMTTLKKVFEEVSRVLAS